MTAYAKGVPLRNLRQRIFDHLITHQSNTTKICALNTSSPQTTTFWARPANTTNRIVSYARTHMRKYSPFPLTVPWIIIPSFISVSETRSDLRQMDSLLSAQDHQHISVSSTYILTVGIERKDSYQKNVFPIMSWISIKLRVEYLQSINIIVNQSA